MVENMIKTMDDDSREEYLTKIQIREKTSGKYILPKSTTFYII